MTKFVTCEAPQCDETVSIPGQAWALDWISLEFQEESKDFCSWDCVKEYAEEMTSQ